MATHSSILAWRIPWMEEPGGLQSMGSQSRTRQSDFTFTFYNFHDALENETNWSETQSSVPDFGVQLLFKSCRCSINSTKNTILRTKYT